MTDLERLLRAAAARADATSAEVRQLVDAVVKDAFATLWAQLVANPNADARKMIKDAQSQFTGAFSEVLAEAFSDLLQRSIGTADLVAMPVGDITLSRKLYDHAAQVANEVRALVVQHAAGVHQARELSIQLYDGYSPDDGVKRPLEGRARAELPKALRSLTEDMGARRELTELQVRGQQQAARVKSEALRAAYLEAFEKWKDGGSMGALQRKLDVAFREKNRFFANRIAQTELARAHAAQMARELLDDDLTTVVQVKLNPAHPRTDICDMHAEADLWGLGPGCYPKEKAPQPTYHPFCWCRLKLRPSLDAANAKRVPNGEAEYLRQIGEAKAAQVMGSRARAEEVLAGARAKTVINRRVPPEYRLRELGEPESISYQLLDSASHEDAAAFAQRVLDDPKTKQPRLTLGTIAPAAIDAADALGVKIGRRYVGLTHDGVQHTFKRHGPGVESQPGQVAVTVDDVARWREIFNGATLALGDPPTAFDGSPMLGGTAELDGWIYGFAAQVRKLDVVLHTLYKRPARK